MKFWIALAGLAVLLIVNEYTLVSHFRWWIVAINFGTLTLSGVNILGEIRKRARREKFKREAEEWAETMRSRGYQVAHLERE